ncbi:hypothetical protein FIU96_15145 [Marinobacter sp. THAF39]|jgi:hypothetical protein|nr:hypothetical protein FIV08_15235 [Marinobacter sp. THAF197a]QFT51973.1 hypothetical protein FIU96_15145 [Marinobacter sp. THAF39]
MAEPKRHMDVPKERVLESSLLLDCSSQSNGRSRDSEKEPRKREGQAFSTNMRPPISICSAWQNQLQ